MRIPSGLWALAIVLLLSAPTRGGLVLALSSVPDEGDNLAIGQSVVVSVDLSGLAEAEELDSLLATILYNAALFSAPVITIGNIVPDPLDAPLDLLTAVGLGTVDVAFLTFSTDSADHISSEGAFFSFEMSVLQLGTGDVSIDFVGATTFNPATPSAPILAMIDPGPNLEFMAVPEPASSCLICLAGIVSILFWRIPRIE